MTNRLKATDVAAIDAAILAGSEPKKTKSGLILSIPGARYKTLASLTGELTAAGKHYYEKTSKEAPQNGFDPTQKPTTKGAQEVAMMLDGRAVVLRSWDGVKREWRFTRTGKAYYKNSPDKYIVRFHVVEMVVRTNRSVWAEKSVLPSTATDLGEMEVPALWPQARQLEEIKRRAREWLRSLESTEIEAEQAVANMEAGTWKVIVSATGSMKTVLAKDDCELEFDKQTITVHERGEVDVGAVLHRPLRQGLPWSFGFKGVCPEALQESDDRCVPLQIGALLKELGMEGHWLDDAFDLIYEELYRGKENNPYIIEVEEGFEERGWREAGVTVAMVQAFAEKNCLAAHAFLGDRKIMSFVPSEKQRTSLCLYIWGDHAFFVDDSHTKGVFAKAEAAPLKVKPETVLAVATKPTEPFDKWEPFDGTLKPGHFYHPDLLSVRLELHRQRICPKVGLSGLGQISTLTVKDCIIHQERREAGLCEHVASQVKLRSGRDFKYCGESMASLASRAFSELCRPPARTYDWEAFYKELYCKQGGRCLLCGGSSDKFEVDHVVPRISGGTDELDNMQLICADCHQQKTTYEQQSRVADESPLISRFSLSTYEAFVKAAKPPQCVADVAQFAGKQAISVDVRRCRYNAFVQQDAWDLPVFSPVDEIKEAGAKLADYQWIEIHLGQKSPRQVFPYFGPGWYGAPTAAFLMDAGIATWSDFKLSFSATAHRPAKFAAERLEILEKLWREAAHLHSQDEDLVAKRASVALLGIWGCRERNLYRLITSSSPFDVRASGAARVSPTPGSPIEHGNSVYQDYVYKHLALELTSMRPIHQRCLEEERLQLARAILMAEKYTGPEIRKKLFSIRVDEIFCWVPDKRFQGDVESMTYDKLHTVLPVGRKPVHQKASSSQAKVYKFNRAAEPIYPGGKLELVAAEQPQPTNSGDWQIFEEPLEGPDEFSDTIVEHVVGGQSCCVEGCAGTGKTEVLKKIEAALEEQGIDCRKICLTHCGARNVGEGGLTACSFVLRNVLHGTFNGGVVMIDEISFMSLELLAALEHLRLKGVRLICFGDYLQFTPISNQWRGTPVAPDVFQTSDLYKAWSCNTKFVLKRGRRSDQGHFNFCSQIRLMPIADGRQLALERYPPRDEAAVWNLVVSNWRRKAINDKMQKEATLNAKTKIWIEDAEVPFHIFAGTRLMGRDNDLSNVKSGAFLIVQQLIEGPEELVDIIDEFTNDRFKLSIKQIAEHTRLRHAMTLYSAQGRSLPGTVAVHDWANPNFTSTSLYVALSRARESDKVWMARR